MKEDITCVFEGFGSVGAIYISNLSAARNTDLLTSLSIKAVVTVVRGGRVQHDKVRVTDHLYVPADDVQSYDLSQHFQETFNFIDNNRKKTNVLVHCFAGISRSATIVIAYLIRKYSYSLRDVIAMVKRKRNKIQPNSGFVDQLKKQAKRIGLVPSQNQQPVEGLLRKSCSPSKKRGATPNSRAKQRLAWQESLGRFSIGQCRHNQLSLLGNNSVMANNHNQSPAADERQLNSSLLKLQNGSIIPQREGSVLRHQLGATCSNAEVQKHSSVQLASSAKPYQALQTGTSITIEAKSEKIEQKIRQLKSRVLDSERKKAGKAHKHSLSESTPQEVTSILVARLNHECQIRSSQLKFS